MDRTVRRPDLRRSSALGALLSPHTRMGLCGGALSRARAPHSRHYAEGARGQRVRSREMAADACRCVLSPQVLVLAPVGLGPRFAAPMNQITSRLSGGAPR